MISTLSIVLFGIPVCELQLNFSIQSRSSFDISYENSDCARSYRSAGGRLCNAFDLVRIHKFYELDYGSKEGTPITRLPSFSAMCEFAMEQPNVANVITAERYERAQS